jgi:hypothetical protein
MAAAEYAGASKRSIPLGQRRWPYRSRGHRARCDRDRLVIVIGPRLFIA